MIISENWAVSTARIETFLHEQPDVSYSEEQFKYRDCVIKLTPTMGYLGDMKIPRTLVYMEGPKEQIEAIYKRFFLRFLSAGG